MSPRRPFVRPRTVRRFKIAAIVLAISLAAMPVLSLLTSNAGETVILLMPPALAAYLWFAWPAVRRIPWWKHAQYLLIHAHPGRGQVLRCHDRPRPAARPEVFWALYFTIAWRLAGIRLATDRRTARPALSSLGPADPNGRRQVQGGESLRRNQRRCQGDDVHPTRPPAAHAVCFRTAGLRVIGSSHQDRQSCPDHRIPQPPPRICLFRQQRRPDAVRLVPARAEQRFNRRHLPRAGANKSNFLEFMLLFSLPGLQQSHLRLPRPRCKPGPHLHLRPRRRRRC